MRLIYFLLFTLLALSPIVANNEHGFISPVKHQLRITGSFAEYRSNHFHAGIDIKSSKGTVGDPLFAVHDGFISRIKIMSGGYGNVLYIEHPNGFTSVYAHMDSFLPEISAYLKEIQYDVESFEVECYLPQDLFLIKQGQEIGKMGTTGRSTGPHLHFELRETKTEKPLNPYLYGIAPQDDIEPQLQNLAVYDLDNMNDPIRLSVQPLYLMHSNQYTLKDTIEVTSTYVGLGVQMFDRMNGASNKNEVYSSKMMDESGNSYSWRGDAFDFEDTKYVNARLDFERKQKVNQNIQLLFSQSCNHLKMIDAKNWSGRIKLEINRPKKLMLEMSDVSGNKVQAEVWFKRKKGEKLHDHSKKTNVSCGKDTMLISEGVTLEIPAATVYYDQFIQFSKGSTSLEGKTFTELNIGSSDQAAHHYYKLSMKLSPQYGDKTCLVKKNKKGVLKNFGGTVENGFFSCRLDEFGSFILYQDDVSPRLETIRYDRTTKKYQDWRFKLTDILDPDGVLDDLGYRANVDGVWVRLKYDKKNDLLIFDDFDKITKSSKNFTIEYWDNQKNKGQRSYKIN